MGERLVSFFLPLVGLGMTASCARGEPPSFQGDAAVAPLSAGGTTVPPASDETLRFNVPAAALASAPAAAPSSSASAPQPLATATTSDAAAPAPGASAGAIDVNGEQTRDKPSASTPAFEARARLLWEAIVSNKPEIARPAFFPLPAYEKVKAVGNPAGDWRIRLVAAYERDIRDLHVALGARAARAKLVKLEVPDERAKWVEPGEEYNKIGYYRVFGSKLKYEVDGRERSLVVKSLISWRGEWYVVHLSAMK